jgi:hypothetical protein
LLLHFREDEVNIFTPITDVQSWLKVLLKWRDREVVLRPRIPCLTNFSLRGGVAIEFITLCMPCNGLGGDSRLQHVVGTRKISLIRL